MIRYGRLLAHIITLVLTGVFLLGYINLSLFSSGQISVSVPMSSSLLLITLIILFLLDSTIFSVRWFPIITFIFGTLIFQNWMIGVILAIVDYILLAIAGRTGV